MITGLILAAGQGKRLGTIKPLLPSDQGAMLEIVINNFRRAELDSLIVVLGFEARRIIRELTLNGLRIVINGEHRMGMSASLQRGLAHVAPGTKAVLVGMGDMPLVTPETIRTLVDAYRGGRKGIVAPVHGKQRGHPVIFDMKYLDELLALSGDVGAKSVLEAHEKDVKEVKIDSDEVLFDVDTPERWAEVLERLGATMDSP